MGLVIAVVLAIRPRVSPKWVYLRPIAFGTVVIWVGATLGLASADGSAGVPGDERSSSRELVRPGSRARLALCRHPGKARLASLLARLIGACALAMALAAAQTLPVLEFSSQSWRATGITATHLYRYSLHPCRVAEMIWPSVFGTNAPVNRCWLQAIPPVGGHEVWVDRSTWGDWLWSCPQCCWVPRRPTLARLADCRGGRGPGGEPRQVRRSRSGGCAGDRSPAPWDPMTLC